MQNTSLIIGMGIGQLYKNVLMELGHKIITVDPDPAKCADFSSVEYLLAEYRYFDTVHICTPNFTHYELANKLARYSRMIFIEKPGVKNSDEWRKLHDAYPTTRFMMVKNNMWRLNINDLRSLANKSKIVTLNWINKNRVPSPGTWFTTKELAFGGVSRDLMPHLLSLYIALNPDWKTDNITGFSSSQNWTLDDVINTDYGTVNKNGIYDVDDSCHYSFTDKWKLVADWKDNITDVRNIEFIMDEDKYEIFELGLCPEDAYYMMIYDAIKNVDNDQYWKEQFDQDIWIHDRVNELCK